MIYEFIYLQINPPVPEVLVDQSGAPDGWDM